MVLMFSRSLPVPAATQSSGFSATCTGIPVSLEISWSSPRSSAPPPVRVIPWSMMSADSSGGVRSRVVRIASSTDMTESASASRTSSGCSIMFFGRPSTRFLPLISIGCSSSYGYAEPISILMFSAVRSPIRRLYFFFTY
ncbi:putative uncharacterized protein [Clostridium sp. CAG:242]|nr:putative uncharacterized protein [Clostridium sp. CAG:242]